MCHGIYSILRQESRCGQASCATKGGGLVVLNIFIAFSTYIYIYTYIYYTYQLCFIYDTVLITYKVLLLLSGGVY